MSFRQAKSRDRDRRDAWQEWIDLHRAELQAIGLPPEVYLSADHWDDFLQNGYLELHPQDCTGFSFQKLSPASAGALRRFLEGQFAKSSCCPYLLSGLRVRHEEGRIP
jgi:hypothetical protein